MGKPPFQETFELNLGYTDPTVNVPGIQKRLENLGFDCGGETDFGNRTRAALARFQKKFGLPVTGKPDDDTRRALEKEHLSD